LRKDLQNILAGVFAKEELTWGKKKQSKPGIKLRTVKKKASEDRGGHEVIHVKEIRREGKKKKGIRKKGGHRVTTNDRKTNSRLRGKVQPYLVVKAETENQGRER